MAAKVSSGGAMHISSKECQFDILIQIYGTKGKSRAKRLDFVYDKQLAGLELHEEFLCDHVRL